MRQETTAEDEVSVRTMIQQRIDKRTEGFLHPNGWKGVLEDLDSNQTYSSHQIYNIQIKCRYIAIALRIALPKMGRGAGGATWSDCCQEAMNTVNQFNNSTYIKFHPTIQGWHLLYHCNSECFPNPNTHKKDGKKTLPWLLEENPLSPDNLARVNQKRNGTKYSDEVAAKAVYGNTNKSPLTSNPFVTEFEYGVAGQGYWDYHHMVIQMEDCIDVLHVLHGLDEYDYIFLFDHLSGHDKQRPDGLSVTKMTSILGGRRQR
jgi:hypothetical protein